MTITVTYVTIVFHRVLICYKQGVSKVGKVVILLWFVVVPLFLWGVLQGCNVGGFGSGVVVLYAPVLPCLT